MATQPYYESYSHPMSGQNRFSRKWGANTKSLAVDPYISGYFFTHWAVLPENLSRVITKIYGFDYNAEKIRNMLASSCLSVNIPGITVNKTEMIGLGGIRHSYVSNVDFDNTVSMRFIEYSGLPIYRIFNGWVQMMRDYRTGTSMLDTKIVTGEYAKYNYAGSVYYWTTKPDGRSVEYYACLTGVFPMKSPQDQFSHDLQNIDKVETDIDFSCDYVWHEDWVKIKCEQKMTEYKDTPIANTIPNYGKTDGANT